KAWKEKRAKYLNHYELAEEAVQPLVFDVYGGYAGRTHQFLRTTVQAMASGDHELFARLWQDLRGRIAVALARGQAEVVNYFNFRNKGASIFSSARADSGARDLAAGVSFYNRKVGYHVSPLIAP